jgi:ribosome recycling factor
MVKEVFKEMERRMKTSLDAIGKETARIRTGRASLSILDGVMVDYYDTPTPLAQLARLTVPEATLIVIQAYDPKVMDGIEKAIRKADLGLNPINDGKVLRLPIPALTEERRKELAKKVAHLGEEGKTEVRHHRREANEAVKKLKTDKEISEDEEHQAHTDIQKLTDKYVAAMDELVKNKEKEILHV